VLARSVNSWCYFRGDCCVVEGLGVVVLFMNSRTIQRSQSSKASAVKIIAYSLSAMMKPGPSWDDLFYRCQPVSHSRKKTTHGSGLDVSKAGVDEF
jgi:hypothetical protein